MKKIILKFGVFLLFLAFSLFASAQSFKVTNTNGVPLFIVDGSVVKNTNGVVVLKLYDDALKNANEQVIVRLEGWSIKDFNRVPIGAIDGTLIKKNGGIVVARTGSWNGGNYIQDSGGRNIAKIEGTPTKTQMLAIVYLLIFK